MSTRQGNVVFMDDLLEEAKAQAGKVVSELRPDYEQETIDQIAEAVGTSAVRFNIINVSPEKGFSFRWEDALSFESGSAPFIMYSHTRACSIHRRVSSLESSEGSDALDIPDVLPQGLVDLLRVLGRHNDCLRKVVHDHRPHLFAEQLLHLANGYNAFYRDCYIIDEGEVNQFFYQVSELARNVLRNGMIGLGIIPLESM